MPFYENLSNVWYHTSCIPESVSLQDPRIDDLSVCSVVGSCPQISRTEDVSFFLNHAMLMRKDPLSIDLGQLLNFVDLWIVENDSCSGAIDGKNCIDLSVEFFANQLMLVVRPDGEDASH